MKSAVLRYLTNKQVFIQGISQLIKNPLYLGSLCLCAPPPLIISILCLLKGPAVSQKGLFNLAILTFYRFHLHNTLQIFVIETHFSYSENCEKCLKKFKADISGTGSYIYMSDHPPLIILLIVRMSVIPKLNAGYGIVILCHTIGKCRS